MLSMSGMQPRTRSRDAAFVRAAAAKLDVSEFEVFRLAHRAWFGRDGNVKSLERVFVVYMFYGQVPAWVRHQCRDMVDPARPADAEAATQPAPDRQHRRHVIILAAAVTAAVFFMTMSSGRIPPGCPGAYVAPSPSIGDQASRPVC